MKFLYILLALMLGACAGSPAENWTNNFSYVLESGTRTKCETVHNDACGMNLYNCSNGYTYLCQKNVVRYKND